MDAMHIAEYALERISEKDPQSLTCGPNAPEVCENNCVGCVARSALKAIDRPPMHVPELCKRGRYCGQPSGHVGECDDIPF
jgi:hypothetical protein